MTCNNAMFSCGTIARMEKHPSIARLYAALGSKIEGQSDFARQLGVTPQRVNNWESRGISIEGAVEAQRKWGVSAVWVLHGEGPTSVGAPSQSERPDLGKISGAVRVLHDWLEFEDEPSEGVYDQVMLSIAMEVVERSKEAVTPTNVIQFIKRFKQAIAQGEDDGKRLLGRRSG